MIVGAFKVGAPAGALEAGGRRRPEVVAETPSRESVLAIIRPVQVSLALPYPFCVLADYAVKKLLVLYVIYLMYFFSLRSKELPEE